MFGSLSISYYNRGMGNNSGQYCVHFSPIRYLLRRTFGLYMSARDKSTSTAVVIKAPLVRNVNIWLTMLAMKSEE